MSGCPHHAGGCAYTGAEPDRCAHCHRSWLVLARDADQHVHGAAYGIAGRPHVHPTLCRCPEHAAATRAAYGSVTYIGRTARGQ